MTINQQFPVAETPYYIEDEISLVDLWVVLVRHKTLLFGSLVFCVVVGMLIAFLLNKQYTYTTSIELGSRIVNSGIVPIEEPQTLLAKIQESFIPMVLQEYYGNNQNSNIHIKMDSRIPKGSEIIVISSKGPEEKENTFKQLQLAVVERVREDHKRILNIIKYDLEMMRNKAVNNLGAIKDGALLIQAREKRITEVGNLLKDQIASIKTRIDEAVLSRKKAVKEASNEPKAMTLLLLDSEIEQQQKRLSELEERLFIKMADNRDQLVKSLADNKREQANGKDNISSIDTQIKNLRETRSVGVAVKSNEPVGMSRKLVVLIALAIGIFSGIFIAFFAEFLAKVKAKTSVEDSLA